MSVLHFVWNTREDYTHEQALRNKLVAARHLLDVETTP